MTFELKCTNGKFCIDNLCLSEITDLFTITQVKDNSFTIMGAESSISLSAKDDDSIEMWFTYKGRMFYSRGYRFAIYRFDSFDIVYLHDESSRIIFSVSIDKESS
jgi:hypothetical protein